MLCCIVIAWFFLAGTDSPGHGTAMFLIFFLVVGPILFFVGMAALIVGAAATGTALLLLPRWVSTKPRDLNARWALIHMTGAWLAAAGAMLALALR